MMDDLHISTSPSVSWKDTPSPTVRRTPGPDRSPSVRRANMKQRSSGTKQPLGVDLTFGNSPSTVRQFRRVSDKIPSEASHSPQYYPMSTDENMSPKTLFSESNSKEAQLGRRAYSKGVGLACQEVLGTTADQEKRDAISRLAEAWSDLEIVDPEGLYHIIRGMNEKLQRYVQFANFANPIPPFGFHCRQLTRSPSSDPKLSSLVPQAPPPESPQRPRLVLAQSNPHLKSHRRRQSAAAPVSPLQPSQLARLPGQQIPGMEHTKQLSDVLYSRWAEGLHNRWPAI